MPFYPCINQVGENSNAVAFFLLFMDVKKVNYVYKIGVTYLKE